MNKLRLTFGVVVFAMLAVLAAACGGGDGGGSGGVGLVAYSTPEEAYADGLQPAYDESAEKTLDFSNSFGSSGDQSRAVEAGQPADIVHFSLEPDMTRLVDAGLVAEDWDRNEFDGIVEDSVVVFVTRPGNPKGIENWDDLLADDVEVLTPNPFTSGGARWNLMAAYGAQVNAGKSEDEALQYLADLLGNVPVQDESARDSLGTFLGGKGDVLLAYENEAIAAQHAGEDVEYTIPDDTILIETPLALTTDADDSAQDFVDFLYSDEGQQIWADYGYRPVVESVFEENEDKFPTPPGLFTIDDLGGWDTVAVDFFDPENGSVAQIERDLGVATE